MVMNIHLDALYLTEPKARSRARRHFFMWWLPKDNKTIKLNGMFHMLSSIYYNSLWHQHQQQKPNLKPFFWIVKKEWFFNSPLRTSATHNPKTGLIAIMQLQLELQTMPSKDSNLGQWKCVISGLVTKWHKIFIPFVGTPGQENLADYQSKNHPCAHHTTVHPHSPWGNFPLRTTLGSEAKHSERVCWTSPGWVHTWCTLTLTPTRSQCKSHIDRTSTWNPTTWLLTVTKLDSQAA